jgi:hypothetical protein
MIWQNSEDLFIGIKSTAKTSKPFTDIFLSNNSINQLNLHASSQLGERHIINDSWNINVNPWSWGNNKQWEANTTEFDKSKEKNLPMILKYVHHEGQEFRISKEKLMQQTVKIRATVTSIDLNMKTSEINYPKNSNKSEPATWLELQL